VAVSDPPAPALGLVASCPRGLIVVSERCILRTQDEQRLVVFGGLPVFGFEVGDEFGAAYAMVLIEQSGFAKQVEIARAFGVTPRTVQRNLQRYAEEGPGALGQGRGWKKGRSRLPQGLQARAAGLHRKSLSNKQIALVLGISAPSVAKLLAAEGLGKRASAATAQVALGLDSAAAGMEETTAAELTLDELVACEAEEGSATGAAAEIAAEPEEGSAAVAALSAVLDACGRAAGWTDGGQAEGGDEASAPHAKGRDETDGASGEVTQVHSWSFDTDPANRAMDRMMAKLGLLEDAIPMFRGGERVAGAGVLLAVPSLAASGVLDVARRVYGSLYPAFYGLRTTFVTLLLMALLRIKRPEGLKERSPHDLGRILGLDRAPEVKTVRRKLRLLSTRGRATEMIQAMAKRRVEQQGDALGFLYVDGHVRVYHGEKTLPKAHVTRMRLSLPATTDYWVNDAAGDPVFVVTAEANAGMVKMLPAVLAELRPLLGERRLTLVFDRGGYSLALFQSLLLEGVDILTYRKGKWRKVASRHFQRYESIRDGHRVEYHLADQEVRIGKGKSPRVSLRQVTRRSEDGHQTPILTSRRDLSTLEVAVRMFDRWRQENFFKYMRDEFALDALVTYADEPDDPKHSVPNPKRRQIEKKLAEARANVKALQAEYGQKALSNPEGRRPTMRGFKISNGRIGRALRAAMKKVEDLAARRAKTPERIAVGKTTKGKPVIKLASEMGRLQNLLKMVAYQAESDLVRLVTPHYPRSLKDGRTLLHAALASPADLSVHDGVLSVTIAAQSSPHRSAAIQALCRELNETGSIFPGTDLRLRFAVAPHPHTS
jgi:hypothetical protein